MQAKDFPAAVAAVVAETRKALIAAAGVLAVISAQNGVPAGAREWAGTVVATLAAYGLTYKVPNAKSV